MRSTIFLFLFFASSVCAQPFHWEMTGGPGTDAPTILEVNTNGDILVGAGTILVRSTDRGVNWLPISIPTNRGDLAAVAVLPGSRIVLLFSSGFLVRMDADGSSPFPMGTASTLLAYPDQHLLVTDRTGALSVIHPPSSVYRTKDQGLSWDTITGPRGEALADFSTDGSVSYVTTGTGIYLSNDGGKTWKRALNGLKTGTFTTVTAGYHDFVAAFDGRDLVISNDAGQNWGKVGRPGDNAIAMIVLNAENSMLTAGGDEVIYFKDSTAVRLDASMYSRAHRVALDSSGRWLGSTQGSTNLFYLSSDTPYVWNPLPAPLSTVGFIKRAYGSIIGGAGGSNFILDSKGHWQSFLGTSAIPLEMDFFDQSIFGISSGTLVRSIDTGRNWTNAFPSLPSGTPKVAASSSSLLYSATNGVFKSTDDGGTWAETNDNNLTGNVTALSVDSNGRLYAACSAALFVTTNQGDSWQQLTLPVTLQITRIVANKNGSIILATRGEAALRTDDGGSSWQYLALPAFAKNSDVMLSATGDAFISCDSGIFFSPAGSTKVYPASDGLVLLTVTSLAMDSAGVMYAGTAGTGVYRSVGAPSSLSVTTPHSPSLTSVAYPNPAAESVGIMLPHGGVWTYSLADEAGRSWPVFSVTRGEELKVDTHSLPAGQYIVSCEQRGEVVSSRFVVRR